MYVEDFICGTNTEKEAIEVYHNGSTIMQKASMALTKWNSNSPVLQKEYETDKHKDSTPWCDSSSKILGLEWDNRKDVFSFSAQDIIEFCTKFSAYPGQEISAPLSPDRIEKSQLFEVCRIDFAGPLILRDGSKVYIALFTYAVTRGIHLELISSLSAECFIQAFRRFFSCRGVCKIIYPDNAKTFKRADKELKYLYKLCKIEDVSRFIVNNGINWKFIVEGAPLWGGFCERLVRSVKTCLKHIKGKSSLTYEELYAVLVEFEAVINSRPITYLYSNVNELDLLSSSHFLTGSKLTVLPSPNAVPKLSKSDLIKRWKYILLMLHHFWKRFYKEYLLELRSAMFSKISKNYGQFKINDVVLIREDNFKRCNWKMGKIKTLYPGRDGKIRYCETQLANGTLRRPIN
ncbi:hypothetical protein AVEN_167192-1 [Araneus ventricosus]|uniref:Integrase catalytic domain-containing protein n=1 Tax=Araneus ventricosus TaxID=182803 RepID=A0A4Y2Q9X9_ARAVE|nr:hypothetical protein AVEN_167192-1 [Araneus ventricosus]